MQVERNEVIHANRGQQPRGNLRRASFSDASALLLPGVAEIGHDCNDLDSSRGTGCVGQERQSHQVLVYRRARGLNDRNDRTSHVATDKDSYLAIGECSDLSHFQGNSQLAGQIFGQGPMRVAGY